MSLARTLQHLLPDGAAWRSTIDKLLRRLFAGLVGEPEAIVQFVDDITDDLYPQTTRELEAWETQFGLRGYGTEQERRDILEATWQATGGQSPRYLQDVLQGAGFDLYVHEWWSSGPPYVARDPRSYTNQPLIGTVQCGEPLAQCGEETALANAFLANEPGYIVNLTLQPAAPPPVPSDSSRWPFFVYVCGATFGTVVDIESNRRAELEELLLKHFPAHLWIVTLINWVDSRITLQSEPRITLAGDVRVTL